MRRDLKNKQEEKDFINEYNHIINSSEKSVIVETQWEQDGDYFQKLSIYDDSYTPVTTLNGTTLIKSI